MSPADFHAAMARLFKELTHGIPERGSNFILNSGDIGLLASLDALSSAEASANVHDGATIAAHAQHVRYGLSLMNRWASEGGNPFADARWDEAWKTGRVDEAAWAEIRGGLRAECERWLAALGQARELNFVATAGLMGSIAHLAYHLGAIRQIAARTRGPREGTFI